MNNFDLFYYSSTKELRDFIIEKISFTSDAMVDLFSTTLKPVGSNMEHKLLIILTAPIFTSITGVYEFKCSVFDETDNKPTNIEFSFWTGFVPKDGYYYFKTEIFEIEHIIRMDEMIDKETLRRSINNYNNIDMEALL